MKIVIDTIPLLSPLTGVGYYTYNIARALKAIEISNDYTYFYGYYSGRLFTYGEDNTTFFKVKEFVKKIPIAGSIARSSKSIINIFSSRNFDIYFEPNFIPINIKAKKTVVAVPDFSFHVHPEWHPKDRISYFENNFWKNIDRADRIIFISDYMKDCAANLYNFPKDRLRTIHLGFDSEIFRVYEKEEALEVRNKYTLPESFILVVGSVEPRKNLMNLLHAYLRLDENIRSDFKIVLVGFKGWNNREIMELLGKMKEDVVYLGYVPDSDLGKLYNIATAFVYPSLYEGFGLPPLEAMACGCPVVVSNVTSLPEVCGDAAYYVNPNDAESIAEGLYKMVTEESLRDSFTIKGLQRAENFSWERSAAEHLKVFEEVLKD